MREQIERLLEAVERPYINVQILPANCASIPGSVSLLTSPSGELTAYTEGFGTGRYMVEPADVDRYRRIYDRLHADALGIVESQEIIREALGKHDD